MVHESLVSLVEALSRKTTFRGPEAMAYLRGIQYAERLFEFNSLCLEKQIKEFKELEGLDDTDYVSPTSDLL